MGSVKGFSTAVIEKIFKDIDALSKKGLIDDSSEGSLMLGPTRDRVSEDWGCNGGEISVIINEEGTKARLPQVFADGEIYINCKLTIPQAEALLTLLKTFTKTGVKPCK